uniref:Zinc finger, RAN-binding domain containing 3 n=1 Tax=Neolamprologus brichardi TaxID=32507 RepID=A0A3Q4HCV7_NEOBR
MEMDDNGLQASCCDTRWSEQLSGLPHKLLQRLMPFQREGVEFALSRNGRAQLTCFSPHSPCVVVWWAQMGLGKTVQAIAVAYTFRQEWPLLVVVPSSLKYPWIEELERWIPELQPGDINLVENKSHTIGIGSSKVTVLGYGLLTTDARPLVEALSRQRFAVVVVDESHYLKSRNAARTKILVPLIQSAKRAILLTGTPALGRPEELFMQIDALYPKRFETWTDYAKKYCNAHYRYFGPRRQWDCRGASNLEELHQRLSQIMIRRLKADVLSQLPPKIRQRIPFDLPKEAAKEASASFAEWERLMKSLGSGAATTDTPFTEVMGLVTQMYKQTAIAKAGAVKDYIKMMLEAEQLKFLVFAHHLTMLQACTEAVIEAKAGYIRIDGSVPSSERIQLVHRFQSDPETRVAILSIQAAGQGLTFTAASHVVFAELYWNPGHVKQAEDRAHRIGQTSSVNVHYLIAKGTFDTVMWSMLNRKEKVTGSTLNGRKEYLKADEGDKDKWEFLNFANAWTPSEMVLPLEGSTGNAKTDVFFTHFEKEKQHDIRSFFSPQAGKTKRKRTEDEESPSVSSETAATPAGIRVYLENSEEGNEESSAGGISAGSPPDPASVWNCGACTYSNSSLLPYCEMCECPRSTSAVSSGKSKEQIISNYPIPPSHQSHPQLAVYCMAASKDFILDDEGQMWSNKVYVRLKMFRNNISYNFTISNNFTDGGNFASGSSLNLSFIPLDIKLTNWDDLPEAFSRRRENRIQVLRFVMEWSGLPAMKQKLLRRCGLLFHSPTLGLQQLSAAQRPHSSTKRYLGRDDVAEASLSKAQEEGGSVRLVTKENFFTKRRCDISSHVPYLTSDAQSSTESSYLQAVDSQGVPLCLSCQQPCSTTGGAWDTRFCSHRCQEEFQLRSSQTYMRSQVLEAERGICQLCGLHAHDLFIKVRDAPPSQRKEILENTWLTQLPLKQLNEMIRAPVEGDFWQVDHIRPVYSGGGQCSLENLQTLCTVCHKARTAQQAKERSQSRKSAAASKVSSDISRFFVRKEND